MTITQRNKRYERNRWSYEESKPGQGQCTYRCRRQRGRSWRDYLGQRGQQQEIQTPLRGLSPAGVHERESGRAERERDEETEGQGGLRVGEKERRGISVALVASLRNKTDGRDSGIG